MRDSPAVCGEVCEERAGCRTTYIILEPASVSVPRQAWRPPGPRHRSGGFPSEGQSSLAAPFKTTVSLASRALRMRVTLLKQKNVTENVTSQLSFTCLRYFTLAEAWREHGRAWERGHNSTTQSCFLACVSSAARVASYRSYIMQSCSASDSSKDKILHQQNSRACVSLFANQH